MKYTPLSEVEMFELLKTAHPDRFRGDDDETWEDVMDFVDSMGGFEDLADLLGRVVMLTAPMTSPLTGTRMHCLGRAGVVGGAVQMESVVRRRMQE